MRPVSSLLSVMLEVYPKRFHANMYWTTAWYAAILGFPIICGYELSGGHNFLNDYRCNVHGMTYDFIIIGSGSSGSVIANRLSEIDSWNVLLLEAGYPEDGIAQYPALSSLLQYTEYNWGFTTEPERKACRMMEGQRCAWPRGRAVGGSSVINYMAYTRGNPQDYERWAALGNPGWSYADVLPYYLKQEDAQLNYSDPRYHHQGGYQRIEDAYVSEISLAFLEAGKELGYKIVDYNSPEQIGFSTLQATIKSGKRESVANAFLKPIMLRKNLHLLTGARVTKILIDAATKRAYGVVYIKADKKFSVTSSREVIVSAGVVRSPQLLMLSGIGPAEELEKFNITTLSNIPVGKSLHDHVQFLGMVINTNLPATSVTNLFNPTQIINWYATGKGPLSSLSGSEALAFINTNRSNTNTYPDVELIMIASTTIPEDFGLLNKKTMSVFEHDSTEAEPSNNTQNIIIAPVVLHPKSEGFLKLQSSDPYDDPLFYANYFTDPEGADVCTMIAGIRFIMKLLKTSAFQRYGVQLSSKPVAGCEALEFDSDQYWYCAIQFLSATTHHQSGTCKMGPANDPTAVVNAELKVYGIDRLRVADTSIVPTTISGHMHGPAMMIGEVVADLIKKEWKYL